MSDPRTHPTPGPWGSGLPFAALSPPRTPETGPDGLSPSPRSTQDPAARSARLCPPRKPANQHRRCSPSSVQGEARDSAHGVESRTPVEGLPGLDGRPEPHPLRQPVAARPHGPAAVAPADGAPSCRRRRRRRRPARRIVSHAPPGKSRVPTDNGSKKFRRRRPRSPKPRPETKRSRPKGAEDASAAAHQSRTRRSRRRRPRKDAAGTAGTRTAHAATLRPRPRRRGRRRRPGRRAEARGSPRDVPLPPGADPPLDGQPTAREDGHRPGGAETGAPRPGTDVMAFRHPPDPVSPRTRPRKPRPRRIRAPTTRPGRHRPRRAPPPRVGRPGKPRPRRHIPQATRPRDRRRRTGRHADGGDARFSPTLPQTMSPRAGDIPQWGHGLPPTAIPDDVAALALRVAHCDVALREWAWYDHAAASEASGHDASSAVLCDAEEADDDASTATATLRHDLAAAEAAWWDVPDDPPDPHGEVLHRHEFPAATLPEQFAGTPEATPALSPPERERPDSLHRRLSKWHRGILHTEGANAEGTTHSLRRRLFYEERPCVPKVTRHLLSGEEITDAGQAAELSCQSNTAPQEALPPMVTAATRLCIGTTPGGDTKTLPPSSVLDVALRSAKEADVLFLAAMKAPADIAGHVVPRLFWIDDDCDNTDSGDDGVAEPSSTEKPRADMFRRLRDDAVQEREQAEAARQRDLELRRKDLQEKQRLRAAEHLARQNKAAARRKCREETRDRHRQAAVTRQARERDHREEEARQDVRTMLCLARHFPFTVRRMVRIEYKWVTFLRDHFDPTTDGDLLPILAPLGLTYPVQLQFGAYSTLPAYFDICPPRRIDLCRLGKGTPALPQENPSGDNFYYHSYIPFCAQPWTELQQYEHDLKVDISPCYISPCSRHFSAPHASLEPAHVPVDCIFDMDDLSQYERAMEQDLPLQYHNTPAVGRDDFSYDVANTGDTDHLSDQRDHDRSVDPDALSDTVDGTEWDSGSMEQASDQQDSIRYEDVVFDEDKLAAYEYAITRELPSQYNHFIAGNDEGSTDCVFSVDPTLGYDAAVHNATLADPALSDGAPTHSASVSVSDNPSASHTDCSYSPSYRSTDRFSDSSRRYSVCSRSSPDYSAGCSEYSRGSASSSGNSY